MKRTVKSIIIVLLAAGGWIGARQVDASVQNPEPSREGVEFFEKKIRPILTANCYGCHSAKSKTPAAALLLDSRDGMLRGGASGRPSIIPGNPATSLLVAAIRYNDAKLQMPPSGKLTDEEIRDIEAWISMGAPDPRTAPVVAAPAPAYDFNEAKKFWAYQPVKDPAIPEVKNQTWARTPVDRFILAKLEEKSLRPALDADKRTLLRRATFDLTGLPPTPAEVDDFLTDSSPDAFAKVVDRLLASRHYGERWGRHWLDLVRYADTAGDNSDFPVPSAFRYRNYAIDSFNADKPYDKFIREQLAGDLLPHKTEAERRENIIATGYLALSRRFGSRNKEFNLTIDDTIDNLGKVFLGLSVSCARCHDHKFDPVPAADYYALYGIFNSSRYAFPGAEIYRHPVGFAPLAEGKAAEDFNKWQRELDELDDRREMLTAEKGYAGRNKGKAPQDASAKQENVEKAEKTAPAPLFPPVETRPADYDRDGMNWGLASKTTRLPEEVEAEEKLVKARIAELDDRAPRVEKAYAVVEGRPANARIHRKGDPKNLGDEAPRGFLQILGGQKLSEDCKGSGRDELAAWIADPKNPLTARVLVNRVWAYHFGRGIVATPNDFGSRGAPPTHPELLDYLASRFIEDGWSIKKLHRSIMLSRTYQSSVRERTAAANVRGDAGNEYFGRFDRRRLSAEEIRDAMLFVSGGLDASTGGEHPFPPERDWRYTQHRQFFAVYDSNRRSVYLMQQRLRKHPLMEVFDGPDTNAATAVRASSTTPVQALYLMNDPFVHAQADLFAVRVGMAFAETPKRIDYAYRLAFGRPATAVEIRDGAQYVAQIQADLKAAGVAEERLVREALASYLRVLLASNEFLYVE
ncbi:MAG: PSD1 domain-containing protein [Acidobacteria bacterium]|nr:PSD1 domain-containing protein [Acidobacteriota bacterium]